MKKRIQSFGYAGRGIQLVFKSEANMKIHGAVALLVVICGFFFQISISEWISCILCVGLVFGAEMINTAIESVVDLVSPARHELAGKAKDIGAGAVLICTIVSVIVGLLIFIPKALALI